MQESMFDDRLGQNLGGGENAMIITDCQYIKTLTAERDDENWSFRVYLKQLPMPTGELDALVHQLTTHVTAGIDCTQCANCCRHIRPILDRADVAEFALGLQKSAREFEQSYLEPYPVDSGDYIFHELPCPFLKDKLCTNYAHRPQNCRSYPHLHKGDFVFRLIQVIENYGVCPIVFNVYEQLKTELGFDVTRGDEYLDYEWL